MGQAVDMVEQQGKGADVLPIFISVDPARDSVEQVKKYVLGECASEIEFGSRK